MKNLYSNLDTFMIRIPSFPINFLVDNSKSKKDLDNEGLFLMNNSQYKNQFDESILLASPDLYDSMHQYMDEGCVKNANYLLNSVYKYFSRSCSRCTPFGLFSTVAFGEISSGNTSFELNNDDIQRNARIDSGWLYSLIFEYETKYLKSLKYTINESTVIYKNRALLFWGVNNTKGDKLNKKSVDFSKALDVVLKSVKEYCPYSDIIEKLKLAYPKTNETVFHEYVQSLIKEEYLISNLRPPLALNDPMNYFIQKLAEYNINTEVFIDLKQKINNYSCNPKKEKKKILVNIFDAMKKMHQSKNYLTVDSSFEYKKCHLDIKEINRINEVINLFIQFNINESNDSLSTYKNKFLEKYGYSRCVPLIELIDNDSGLGFPAHYVGENNTFVENSNNPWINFFERKYIDSIRKQREIEITNVDINNFMSDIENTKKLPQSMEIYLNYYKKNGKDFFLLSNIFGSMTAGKSFGRFSHLMNNPKKFYKKINSVYKNDKDCQTCEFTFLPEELYTANVIRNNHGSDYEISFGTTNSRYSSQELKLSEILIGIEDNNFYFQSLINQKRIIPTATNMFNSQLKPNILRLIDEISADELKIYNRPWQFLLRKFGYIPTIRYKNFILEQEKWMLSMEDLELPKQFNFSQFDQNLKKILKSKNIPSWINVVEGDQKLLLNLEENRCIRVIKKMLAKSSLIIEGYNKEIEHPVKYKEHSYCCELVIPLVLNKENNQSKIAKTMFLYNHENNRIIEPLDGWLYLKIYGIEESIDYLLSDALYYPLQEMIKDGDIQNYFFIQYKDPDAHLRLRIKSNKLKNTEIQTKILNILSNLLNKSLISKYCIDCYELELERYGGKKLIDYAHDVFCDDSHVVQLLIREKEFYNISISDEFLGIIIIFFHLSSFKLSLEDMFIFLNCEEHVKQYQEEFKINKKLYIDFTIHFFLGDIFDEKEQLVLDILSKKNKSISIYYSKIKEEYSKDKNVIYNILNSLIHMSMNRLFGTNVDFEKKVRILARHTFYNVFNMNKKIGMLEGQKNAKI